MTSLGVSEAHQTLPVVTELTEQQFLNKLVVQLLLSRLPTVLAFQHGQSVLNKLDSTIVFNRYHTDVKPVMIVYSSLTEFSIKKLHRKYHLINISGQDNAQDKRLLEPIKLALTLPQDLATLLLEQSGKIHLDGYLEKDLLSVVVNQSSYLTFEVGNINKVLNGIKHRLLVDAG